MDSFKRRRCDMKKLNLSPEERRRLWQCYSLLLRLADEAEENNVTDSELCEGHELLAVIEVDEATRLDDDAPDVKLEQIEDPIEMNVNEITSHLWCLIIPFALSCFICNNRNAIL
jgi:hypothetical protein